MELVALAGHTPDDVIMLLPENGIAFLADLLFVGFHPYLSDGNPDDWQAQDLARHGTVPDASLPIPAAFRPWGFGKFFPANVKFVWERRTAGGR